MLRVIDTFSGIGGFAIGLETAGLQTVAFCEVLPIRRHLLAHHFPGVPQYDDIRTLTGERLRADGIAAEVICGGFPCQDLSFAGNGAGLAGERSGLWFELARLVREVGPDFVILENVAALLVQGLGVVVGELAALGYDLWWDCIPASAVGAPHRRDRIWIVAYTRSVEHEGFGDAFRRAIAEELHGYAYQEGEPGSALDAEASWGEDDVPDAAWDDAGWPNARADRERIGPSGESGADLSDAHQDDDAPGLDGRGNRRETGESEGRDESYGEASYGERLRSELGSGGEALPDANQGGIDAGDQRGQRSSEDDSTAVGRRSSDGGGSVWDGGTRDASDASEAGLFLSELETLRRGGWWEERRAVAERGWRFAVSRMGVLADGLPTRLDALHGGFQTEPPLPRVAKDIQARVGRLAGLGDSVVPQIPAMIGRAILTALEEINGEA